VDVFSIVTFALATAFPEESTTVPFRLALVNCADNGIVKKSSRSRIGGAQIAGVLFDDNRVRFLLFFFILPPNLDPREVDSR
jgi:hypothetical protein